MANFTKTTSLARRILIYRGMASTKFFFWSWVFQSSNIYMSNHELRMVSRPNVTPCARRSQLHGRHELCWGYLFCCLFAKIYISVKRLFSDLEALIPCFRILYIRVYIYIQICMYISIEISIEIYYIHMHIYYTTAYWSYFHIFFSSRCRTRLIMCSKTWRKWTLGIFTVEHVW